jgi:hypothetical protein
VQNAVFGGNGAGETYTLVQTELDVIAALGWKVALPQAVFDASGNWETPTNWDDGFMPITPEDAFVGVVAGIDAALTSNVTVNSIGTNASSTLEISGGGHLTATNGTVLNPERTFTWASGNLGAINIDVGSTLTIGATFDNEGAITVGVILSSAGGAGSLVLNGTVTLNGANGSSGSGLVYLGQQSDTFRADSAGSITGGGLLNVNNTIVGGGVIDLSSVDNQSGGLVDANQSEGNSLQIIASTFTNEGTLQAESRSVLDLGKDGGTGSLTNNGTIALESEGDLAISGAYTIAGSGDVGFKGAGADITSDGHAPATFINQSSIDAAFSGQIGDEGVSLSNDLTFENSGTVGASGSGVKLTLNTGGLTINDGGGTLGAGNGATLAIDSNVDTGEVNPGPPSTPPGGTIEANSSGTVILSAAVADGISRQPSVSGQIVIAGGTFEMLSGSSVSVPIEFTNSGTLEMFGASQTVSVQGSNGTIDAASGDTISLTSGTGDTLSGSGFTVDGGSRTGFKIKGTSDVVYAGLNDAISDGGSSSLFKIASNVGKLSISGFGADPTGVIDLLNGVGGYKTANAAFAALTSDGSGGAKLSLGSDGSIDIAGVAPSSLHVTNFKVD